MLAKSDFFFVFKLKKKIFKKHSNLTHTVENHAWMNACKTRWPHYITWIIMTYHKKITLMTHHLNIVGQLNGEKKLSKKNDDDDPYFAWKKNITGWNDNNPLIDDDGDDENKLNFFLFIQVVFKWMNENMEITCDKYCVYSCVRVYSIA